LFFSFGRLSGRAARVARFVRLLRSLPKPITL
jgi:hypothetical protein